ncbi:hypothetical protein JYJ95_22395 [Corallococcus exiguus]|uniref:RNA polymerase sigma factor n=1 Tax=Corallococcus exiguus TaxID=83462 RepID=UPI001A8D9609|nr:hypothetical protein [Corallococcus exiguus]MBN8469260.1 hypothetical protein [Corallococcus exiguus]
MVDCLQGRRKGGFQKQGLLGSYFTVCALELFDAPPLMLESLHLRLEEAVRAASPGEQAQLMCVQHAMERPLMGVSQIAADRRAALLSSLADFEVQAPRTLGKAAPGVRAWISESVDDEDASAFKPMAQGPIPERSPEDWAQVKKKTASTVLSMTSDMCVVEDIVQEALLKTVVGDRRTQGKYRLGGLIRYARTVAYNGTLRAFRDRSRWCSLTEEAPADSAGEENCEAKDHTPASEPARTDHLDLLLHVPEHLGQLKPKDGLLIFADLAQVPRWLLSAWMKASRKTLNTAIFRAWKALEKIEAAPLRGAVEEAILGKLEPFGLALAEAATTSDWEWHDDDPPPSGGGAGGGRGKNSDGLRNGETQSNTRGDAMAHDDNDYSKLRSPLAMLLGYAARTKKRVPLKLLVEAELESLGRETQEALRNADPVQWQVAMDMRGCFGGQPRGLPGLPIAIGPCLLHAFPKLCREGGRLQKHIVFVQVSLVGEVGVECVGDVAKALEGLCYRAFELKANAVVLDLRAVSRGSDCMLPELRKMADQMTREHGLELSVAIEQSQQGLWKAHGFRTFSAPDEIGPCEAKHGILS